MKTLKGLFKSDKAPLRRPVDPEFDDLHRQYKDLRAWIEQVCAVSLNFVSYIHFDFLRQAGLTISAKLTTLHTILRRRSARRSSSP